MNLKFWKKPTPPKPEVVWIIVPTEEVAVHVRRTLWDARDGEELKVVSITSSPGFFAADIGKKIIVHPDVDLDRQMPGAGSSYRQVLMMRQSMRHGSRGIIVEL